MQSHFQWFDQYFLKWSTEYGPFSLSLTWNIDYSGITPVLISNKRAKLSFMSIYCPLASVTSRALKSGQRSSRYNVPAQLTLHLWHFYDPHLKHTSTADLYNFLKQKRLTSSLFWAKCHIAMASMNGFSCDHREPVPSSSWGSLSLSVSPPPS